MDFIKKLFRPEKKEEKEVMVGITSVTRDKLPENANLIAESKIPAFCKIGNLIFDKKYHEAIEFGNKLLQQTPNSKGVHVNLMDAYFKIRNENPSFYEKCLDHARLAMLYGHNTGYVQERLAISLEMQGKINQALQICNIVLSEKFQFSSHGCGRKEEFVKRREKLLKKINRAIDNETDLLYTPEEISKIIENSQVDEFKKS